MPASRIAVLGAANSWYFRDLSRAAEQRGDCTVTAAAFSSLRANLGMKPALPSVVSCPLAGGLQTFDAVLVRTMPPGSLEQVVFRMNALARVEAAGTTVVNPPRSLEIAIDKYLTLTLLEDAGLPVPPTRVCQTVDEGMQAFAAHGGDVVVKPLFGGEGRGICRIDDEAVAHRVFKSLVPLGAVLYLQQFLPHRGFDLRLLVIGDRVLGYKRRNPDDWRTNVSRGARTEPLKVTARLRDMALAAARATGVSVAGVDVLPAEDGRLFVLEVNAVPGWQAAAKILEMDIASEVLGHTLAVARKPS